MKFLILLIFTITYHGDNLANFTITKNNGNIHISAMLNTKDLEKAIGSVEPNTTNKTLLNYLSNNMSYRINNQQTSFIINTVKKNNQHVVIELSLTGTFDAIANIEIKNKLLFDVNDKQANVVEIRFDGMVRGFLINKNKPVLNINLNK